MSKKVIILVIILVVTIGTFLHIKKSPSENSINNDLEELSISSGVVPHHLVAKEIIENFFRYISAKGKPQNIVLLGPDHFNATSFLGKPFISVDSDTKEFHSLNVNNFLLQKLDKQDLAFDSSAINLDHAITDLLPFFKKYFPETAILPILISPRASQEDVEKLIKIISVYGDLQTIIVASVDFSHYLPPRAADFHDVKSIATLLDFKKDDFKNLEVDSWQALYGARFFARLQGKEFPYIVGQGRSSDFLEFTDSIESEGVTSYFSVVFVKENKQEFFERGKTILLVGDIMLGREVESLIKKNSVIYPFQRINQFLKGVDIVFGNLEGPIVKKPQNFSLDSLRFNFSPQVVDSLSWANFSLLSLANNHTLDRGENGLKETKQFLKEKNIDFVGDPIKCTEDFSFKKDEIAFLAFNKTFPFNCPDEKIVNTINLIKSSNPESFLIVTVHWGEEYQEKNSISQRELAHKIIEAGADVIVGHHPHVVQNIGIYKNKLIFYSLGNFVFDQYFSEETQKGLAVGIEIYNNRVRYRLFPFKSYQSQPSLMNNKETNQFLERLALKSSPDLLDKIKYGTIDIERSRY